MTWVIVIAALIGALVGGYLFYKKCRAGTTIANFYSALFSMYNDGDLDTELSIPGICLANSTFGQRLLGSHPYTIANSLQSCYEEFLPFIKPYFPVEGAFRNIPKNTKYNWQYYFLTCYTNEFVKLLGSDQSPDHKKEFLFNITKTHVLCCKILESGSFQYSPNTYSFFDNKCKQLFQDLKTSLDVKSENDLNEFFLMTVKIVRYSYFKIIASLEKQYVGWYFFRSVKHVGLILAILAIIWFSYGRN